MTIKIYSNVQPGLLLHMVYSGLTEKGREDIVHPDNFIQCADLRFDKGKTFKPHKHIVKERSWNVISQESWCVLKGSVRCHFYDIDGEHLQDVDMGPGFASFTLHGGHSYTILEDDTHVREYKTGKYEGQENDKIFL